MANHSIPIQETRLGATPATPRGQVPNETEVRREIEHVLSSSVFRGSKRCHDFTNYVCAKTLQGASGTLKERTIAIDVFGRRTNEAVGDDNIVRVGAREVRKRLALYYAGEGAEDPVRIELPTGTYVPIFRYQSEKSNFAVHPHAVEDFRQSLRRTLGGTTGPGSGSSQGQLQPLRFRFSGCVRPIFHPVGSTTSGNLPLTPPRPSCWSCRTPSCITRHPARCFSTNN